MDFGFVVAYRPNTWWARSLNGLLICHYYFISFPKWLASLLLADLLSFFQRFFETVFIYEPDYLDNSDCK